MQPIDSDKHNVQSPDRQKLTEKKNEGLYKTQQIF